MCCAVLSGPDSQEKLWWRILAILTCKINSLAKRQRLIDPFCSLFSPVFPTGLLEMNNFQHVTPMIKGIGNSQTFNGQDQVVAVGGPLVHVRTLFFFLSLSLLPPPSSSLSRVMCEFTTPPCVHSKLPCVLALRDCFLRSLFRHGEGNVLDCLR